MTAFTGPFHVKQAFSESTGARVGAEGSAQFHGPARVSGFTNLGASTITGAETVNGAFSAANTFVAGSAATLRGLVSAAQDVVVSGRVRSGAGSAVALGDVVLTQGVTVRANATAQVTVARVPSGAEIVDIYQKTITSWGTAGATIDLYIGVCGKDDRFGTFSNVSGRHGSIFATGTPSGRAMQGCSANMNILAKTTAASGGQGGMGSAASAGLKLVTVAYRRRL